MADNWQYSNQTQSNINYSRSLNENDIAKLKELLQKYEKKISKVSKTKEQLRQNLSKIEGEVKEAEDDMKKNMDLIQKVETEIEKLNNDITNEESKKMREQQQEKQSANKDEQTTKFQKQKHNKEIFKYSLNKNLQVISNSLDSKEKERTLISGQINKITDKENNYLQIRYTIEDMIKILDDSIKQSKKEQNSFQGNSDFNVRQLNSKQAEISKQLLQKNEEADKFSFINIHLREPYKITKDILNMSNEKINSIEDSIIKKKSEQSETIKSDLKILYDLIESKLQLMREQNYLVEIIYIFLSSLKDSDIKRHFTDQQKESKQSGGTIEDKLNQNIEYIYKEIIVNHLKDIFWKTNEEEKILKIKEDKSSGSLKNYLEEKMKDSKVIKERNLIKDKLIEEHYKNRDDLFFDVLSYDYKNEKECINKPKK